MKVAIVEPARCIFCQAHRETRNLIGPAGLIFAFVVGMTMAPDTTLEGCAACADALNATIKANNTKRSERLG